MEHQINTIFDAYGSIADEIEVEAKKISDAYFNNVEVLYHGKEIEIDQKPKFALSVRKRKRSVSIEWRKVVFKKYGNKWHRQTEYIAPSEKGIYPLSKFKSAPEWQRDAIMEVEPKLAELRIILKKMNNQIKAVNSLKVNHLKKDDGAPNEKTE